jgi:hypothetical protein
MGQDMPNIHPALDVEKTRNQPISIATDVKHDEVANDVCRGKRSPNLIEIGETIIANQIVPFRESIVCATVLGMGRDKLSDCSPRNNSVRGSWNSTPGHTRPFMRGSSA